MDRYHKYRNAALEMPRFRRNQSPGGGIDAAGPRSRQISLCGFGEGVEMCLISTQDMYGGIDAAGPRSRGNARIERSTDLITLESESARSHGSVVGGSCRRRDRRREAARF